MTMQQVECKNNHGEKWKRKTVCIHVKVLSKWPSKGQIRQGEAIEGMTCVLSVQVQSFRTTFLTAMYKGMYTRRANITGLLKAAHLPSSVSSPLNLLQSQQASSNRAHRNKD